MKYDYIIVGSGLASIMFAEQLRLHNKSFIVISNRSQQASVVASGLYNPVVLKRFTATWNVSRCSRRWCRVLRDSPSDVRTGQLY